MLQVPSCDDPDVVVGYVPLVWTCPTVVRRYELFRPLFHVHLLRVKGIKNTSASSHRYVHHYHPVTPDGSWCHR